MSVKYRLSEIEPHEYYLCRKGVGNFVVFRAIRSIKNYNNRTHLLMFNCKTQRENEFKSTKNILQKIPSDVAKQLIERNITNGRKAILATRIIQSFERSMIDRAQYDECMNKLLSE